MRRAGPSSTFAPEVEAIFAGASGDSGEGLSRFGRGEVGGEVAEVDIACRGELRRWV